MAVCADTVDTLCFCGFVLVLNCLTLIVPEYCELPSSYYIPCTILQVVVLLKTLCEAWTIILNTLYANRNLQLFMHINLKIIDTVNLQLQQSHNSQINRIKPTVKH